MQHQRLNQIYLIISIVLAVLAIGSTRFTNEILISDGAILLASVFLAIYLYNKFNIGKIFKMVAGSSTATIAVISLLIILFANQIKSAIPEHYIDKITGKDYVTIRYVEKSISKNMPNEPSIGKPIIFTERNVVKLSNKIEIEEELFNEYSLIRRLNSLFSEGNYKELVTLIDKMLPLDELFGMKSKVLREHILDFYIPSLFASDKKLDILSLICKYYPETSIYFKKRKRDAVYIFSHLRIDQRGHLDSLYETLRPLLTKCKSNFIVPMWVLLPNSLSKDIEEFVPKKYEFDKEIEEKLRYITRYQTLTNKEIIRYAIGDYERSQFSANEKIKYLSIYHLGTASKNGSKKLKLLHDVARFSKSKKYENTLIKVLVKLYQINKSFGVFYHYGREKYIVEGMQEYIFDEFNRLIDAGKFQEAVEYYRLQKSKKHFAQDGEFYRRMNEAFHFLELPDGDNKLFQLALYYRRVPNKKRYAQYIKLLEELVNSKSVGDKALYLLGRNGRYLVDPSYSAKSYLQLVIQFPESPLADDALAELAFLHGIVRNEPELGRIHANQVILKFPDRNAADNALFILGQIEKEAGNIPGMLLNYVKIIADYPKNRLAKQIRFEEKLRYHNSMLYKVIGATVPFLVEDDGRGCVARVTYKESWSSYFEVGDCLRKINDTPVVLAENVYSVIAKLLDSEVEVKFERDGVVRIVSMKIER